MHRTARFRRGGAIAVAAALAVTGLTALAAAADPARPVAPVVAAAAPAPAVELFHEGFEHDPPTAPPDPPPSRALVDYVGAGGETYTAEDGWALPNGCNGFVLNGQESNPFAGCASYGSLQGLATALGAFNGTEPSAANHAVAAFTDNDGTSASNAAVFRTAAPLPLEVANRFLTFAVTVRAVNCNSNPNGRPEPELYFFLDDAGTEIPVNDAALNPCAGGVGEATVQLTSDGSVLFDGNALGIVMRNNNGTSGGNDFAFDDIRILDATPALDKEFTPAAVDVGGAPATLRFTVTNTMESAAKAGWSFTDTLPAGMTVASPPNAATDCANGVPTANAGEDTVSLTGDLEAGDVSCTFTVDVVTYGPGTYANAPADVTTVGLNPPAEAELTVTAPTPFDCRTPTIFLAQNTSTQLDSLTPGSTDLTPISPAAGITYNAIALNPLDDLIYGLRTSGVNGQGHLLRIDATGNIVDLGPTSPSVAVNAGTFDDAGNYYVVSSAGGPLRRINIATRETVSTPTGGGALPADIAWVGGALWGQRANTDQLVRIDAGTGATTVFSTAGLIPATVAAGAAWTYGNGNLGLSDNNSGTIYQIRIDDPNSATPTFTVVSTQTGPGSGNNDGTACAGAPVDLAISKTVSPQPALPGQTLTYTLTVANNGPGNSSGFVVTDTLPADLANPGTTTTGCTIGSGTLTCVGGSLAAGEEFVITYTGVAPAAHGGTLTNAASVTGNEEDPAPGNNTVRITTPILRPGGPGPNPTPAPSPAPTVTPSPTVTPGPAPPGPTEPAPERPDLAVTKTGPARMTAGDTITWRIQVRNRGTGPSVGAVLTDTVPQQLTSAGVQAPAGVRCSSAGRTVTCKLGRIDPGDSVKVVVKGKVGNGASGPMRNVARVKSPGDSHTANNRDDAVTQVRPRPQVQGVQRPPSPRPSAPPSSPPSSREAEPCVTGPAGGRGSSPVRPGGDC